MRYFGQHGTVTDKADNSPVTEADLAANQHIVKRLRALSPEIPVISEESRNLDAPAALQSGVFWCVDPLDGTKSFIKGMDEFTVNIGLIRDYAPALGVVYAPARSTLYWGVTGDAAWKQVDGGKAQRIRARKMPAEGATVFVSRSHKSFETDLYLRNISVAEEVPSGSSIKFCLVAEGVADLYPRFGPTMEWDTAAGQAVLEAAGGSMTTPEGHPFRYGKPEFRNGYFIAQGKL